METTVSIAETEVPEVEEAEIAEPEVSVLQIMPSDGYYAAFAAELPGGAPSVTFKSILCWALVENKKGQKAVEGMIAGECVWHAEDDERFMRYTQSSESNYLMEGEAAKLIRKIESEEAKK